MDSCVAILVSGVLRSFTQSLEIFFNQLPENFHIFLCCPKTNTDQYLNKSSAEEIQRILKNPRIKAVTFQDFDDHNTTTTTTTTTATDLDQRETNTITQWKRIAHLFETMKSTEFKYQTVVRCRPDIHFQCDIQTFLAYFRNPVPPNTLLIPAGFDIFHSSFKHTASINDHFAIGSFAAMQQYCNMFEFLKTFARRPLISEEALFAHLAAANIQVQRIDLPYTLLLSQCFTISICGDSASGKTSLSRLLQQTLPFDKTLLFETDRYHKWERGSENYKQFTHLHPEANHLEKLSTDAYKLRLGEDVFLVDYDHVTGKFTEPTCVKPQNFTIFCGLHTLYLDSLRSMMDLKIYMDTEASLKMHWKLTRDTQSRGASPAKVLETIQTREPDFRRFVEPQKSAANLIFQYFPRTPAAFEDICLQILIRKQTFEELLETLRSHLTAFGTLHETPEFLTFMCDASVTSETLTAAAMRAGYDLQRLKPGYDGIIQYLFILLIWNSRT